MSKMGKLIKYYKNDKNLGKLNIEMKIELITHVFS